MASIRKDYYYQGGYYGYYQFDVWESSVDEKNNQSTVSWTLTAGGASSPDICYDFYLYASINDTAVYSRSGSWSVLDFPAKDGSTSGSMTIKHNTDGSKSINFYMEGYRFVYSTQSGSGTLVLTNIKTNTISYNANGGSSTPKSQVKIADSSIKLASAISRINSDYNVTTTFNGNGGLNPPKSYKTTVNRSYSFNGWKSNADGVVYSAGANYKKNQDTTMVAQWAEDLSPGVVPLSDMTITRDGYTFKGWSTSLNGDIITEEYKPTSDNTLYAIWEANTYTVEYDANGGGGNIMPPSVFTYDKSYRLSANTYSNGAFDFLGWSTSKTGTVTYTNGELVSNLTTSPSITLYAVWGDTVPPEIKSFNAVPSARSISISASVDINYDGECYYSINGGDFVLMTSNVKYQAFNKKLVVDNFIITGLDTEESYTVAIQVRKKSTGAVSTSKTISVSTTYYSKLLYVTASDNLTDGININYNVKTVCNYIKYKITDKDGSVVIDYGPNTVIPSNKLGDKNFIILNDSIIETLLDNCSGVSNKFKLSMDCYDTPDGESIYSGGDYEFNINFNDLTATDKIRASISNITLTDNNGNTSLMTEGLDVLTLISRKGSSTARYEYKGSVLKVSIKKSDIIFKYDSEIKDIVLYDKDNKPIYINFLEETIGGIDYYYATIDIDPEIFSLLIGTPSKLLVKIRDSRGICSNGLSVDVLTLLYTNPKITSAIFNREVNRNGLSVNLKCDFFVVPREYSEPEGYAMLQTPNEEVESTQISPSSFSNNNYIKTVYIGFSDVDRGINKLDKLGNKVAYQSIPGNSFTGSLVLNAEDIDTTVSPDRGYVFYVIIEDKLNGSCLFSTSIPRLVPLFNKQKGVIKDEHQKDISVDRYSFNTEETIDSTFFFKTEDDADGFVIDDTDMRINKGEFDLLCRFLYTEILKKPLDWDDVKTKKYFKKDTDGYYYYCEESDSWGDRAYYEINL